MIQPNKILIFDICGQFAHFRKYYTNASSLSYSAPPRTVIAGLIAGVLGIERDEYYDVLNTENTRIAVAIKSGFRKIMQTVNYSNTKTWNFAGNPQQVNLEIIVPVEKENIRYRVFFYNQNYIDILSEQLIKKKYVYNPYLGISEFLSDIEYIDCIDETRIERLNESNKTSVITTCFPKELILNIDFSKMPQFLVEKMPVNFKNIGDNKRNLYKFADYVYSIKKNIPLFCYLKEDSEAYKISYNYNNSYIDENIIFMEPK